MENVLFYCFVFRQKIRKPKILLSFMKSEIIFLERLVRKISHKTCFWVKKLFLVCLVGRKSRFIFYILRKTFLLIFQFFLENNFFFLRKF